MSGGLVLRLRPREKFLVNGVLMENGERRAKLRVASDNANILRFRDAMHPDDANTPTKRLYYIAQLAVAGEADAEETKKELLKGLKELRTAFGDHICNEDIDAAIEDAGRSRFYHVMRALYRVIPYEATLLMVANVNEMNTGKTQQQ
ncbi:MAG: flagellar biosynthesis repressor FlbT [Parvularculaceae bacterium]